MYSLKPLTSYIHTCSNKCKCVLIESTSGMLYLIICTSRDCSTSHGKVSIFPVLFHSVSIPIPFCGRFFFISFSFLFSELKITSAHTFKALVMLATGHDGVH